MNYYGFYTLLKKETWRFCKVYHQTILSPVINVLLMLAIFSLAIGGKITTSYEVPFIDFLSAGLIIMSAIQNAFANTSSSLVMGKVLGHIIDYLVPPLSNLEILLAMVLSSILRGVMVGGVAILCISFFHILPINSIFYTMFFIIFGSMFLALLGMLCGIISNSFDQMSAITSYFITPMTFLSGTFYSIKDLPIFWQKIAHSNPFFYIIDGFRYGMTGHQDSSDISTGVIFMILINISLGFLIYFLLKTKLKIS